MKTQEPGRHGAARIRREGSPFITACTPAIATRRPWTRSSGSPCAACRDRGTCRSTPSAGPGSASTSSLQTERVGPCRSPFTRARAPRTSRIRSGPPASATAASEPANGTRRAGKPPERPRATRDGGPKAGSPGGEGERARPRRSPGKDHRSEDRSDRQGNPRLAQLAELDRRRGSTCLGGLPREPGGRCSDGVPRRLLDRYQLLLEVGPHPGRCRHRAGDLLGLPLAPPHHGRAQGPSLACPPHVPSLPAHALCVGTRARGLPRRRREAAPRPRRHPPGGGPDGLRCGEPTISAVTRATAWSTARRAATERKVSAPVYRPDLLVPDPGRGCAGR